MEFDQELTLRVVDGFISLIVALAVVGVGWAVGQRIAHDWAWRNKQRELDRAAGVEVYKHYGEFQNVRRLWVLYGMGKSGRRASASDGPDETRWNLLERAVTAESGMEGALLRLAAERPLSLADCQDLGRVRQAYQRLREGIRDNDDLRWDREQPEYQCFKRLTMVVGSLLAQDPELLPLWRRAPRPPSITMVQDCQKAIMARDRALDWCPEGSETTDSADK